MARVNRRIGLLFAVFVVLLGAAMARASYLDVVEGARLQAWAQGQAVATVTTPAPRGEITDRTGVVLALSESADQVDVDPRRVHDAAKYAPQIASLTGLPVSTVLARLTKNTTYAPVALDVPAAKAAKIASLGVNSLWLTPEEQRVYPRSTTAAQVLGFVGRDGSGLGGVELRFDRQLSGQAGVSRVVYDGQGQPISVQALRTERAGAGVTLTIDAAIQNKVEQVLAGVGAQYAPAAATAIVMNPTSGEVLALANWPFVNANDIGATPFANTADYGVQYQYEPGSTFKAITVAGALQDGIVTPRRVFDIPPELHVGTYTIQDAESHGYEQLTVAQILKHSSNIGADEIASLETPGQFDSWVRRFGFGSPTGIRLGGEAPGDVPHVSQYTQTTMYTLPFGQGISVTPMQMAAAYSAIADGGILREPRIVRSIGGKRLRPARGRRVISAGTAAELRDMLRGVFADGGTASGAAIPGYDLAGKTGTAQVAINGKYSRRSSSRRSSAWSPRAPRSCWWRSSCSSRRGASTAALWPRLRSRRSSAGPLPTCGSTRARHRVRRLRSRRRVRRFRDLAERAPERLEPVVPLAPDRRDPRDGLRQRRRRQAVAHVATSAFALE
jgi:cell division protein FtsI/penicillin-binding protein 2